MDEATKAASAGQMPEDRGRKVADSMFDGAVITKSRRAATIAEAIRASWRSGYERGLADGQDAEREACLFLCENLCHPLGEGAETGDWSDGVNHCAKVIGERGQKERRHG